MGARQFEAALLRAQATVAAAGRRHNVPQIDVRKMVALEAQIVEAKKLAASHKCVYVFTTNSKLIKKKCS